MFERFTEQAHKVMVLVEEEAARFGHDYKGTEHLLLGLLREEEGVAARALNSLNVTSEKAREQVESVVGYGERGTGAPVGQGPFAPRSKRVLELALREALRLGHNYVGTEHILLGLVLESEGAAVRILLSLGVGPDEVRREILGMMGGRRPKERPADRAGAAEYGRTSWAGMVRARVEALEVHARCGVSDEERALPQTLLVDLEYVYEAQGDDDVSGVVDYGTLLESVARLLEREEFRLLETGMRRVGGRVLQEFPRIEEIKVRITKVNVPVARTVAGASVEATFGR